MCVTCVSVPLARSLHLYNSASPVFETLLPPAASTPGSHSPKYIGRRRRRTGWWRGRRGQGRGGLGRGVEVVHVDYDGDQDDEHDDDEDHDHLHARRSESGGQRASRCTAHCLRLRRAPRTACTPHRLHPAPPAPRTARTPREAGGGHLVVPGSSGHPVEQLSRAVQAHVGAG